MPDESKEMAEELKAQGLRHGHIHPHMEEHYNEHWHGHVELHAHINGEEEEPHRANTHHRDLVEQRQDCQPDLLIIRSHSGISGDIILAGLAVLYLANDGAPPDSPEANDWLAELCGGLFPELAGCATLHQASVNGIKGWRLHVNLPHSHEHRHLGDINLIIDEAAMLPDAKQLAKDCFLLLAQCEADIHGISVNEVHFHEVGALDSILDICVSCEIYARLGRPGLHCGSLPIADGIVKCAHGVLPAPAPAALRLLRGIPVHPFPGSAQAGELLTPTGIALLKTFKAKFGRWPSCRILNSATIYGQKEFPDAPNGVIFAMGK